MGSALDHITKSGYGVDVIRNFRCSGETPTKSPYEWFEDPSVPNGWKTTMITVNSFGKNVLSKRYLSPDGRFCSSRIDALKYMAPDFTFLRSTRSAQTYMKNSDMYGQDHVDGLNNLVDEGRKRIRLEKYGGGGKQSDSTIPQSWKMKILAAGP